MRLRLLVLAFILAGAPACAATEISIGSKKFTESYVLSEIAKTLLEQAGFEVTHREGMGGTIILWQALRHGDIALYPEYTGTIADEILKAGDTMTPEAMQAALAKHGIGMTKALGFNDTYALVMRRDQAEKLGIRTIGDLRNHPGLRAGPTPEFLGRRDGWEPLLARYGLHFDGIRGIEHGLGYSALKNGQIDIKDAYATDAKIGAYDLLALQDDLGFFPQYQAVFLYRLDAAPQVVNAVRTLEGQISQTKMIELNGIAEKTKDYASAAAAFSGARTGAPPEPKQHSFLANIPRLTAQHLTLTGVSLLAAILVSIPLGIVASHPGLASQLILGTAGIIQTIPSLALLALMIPLFGVGPKPAIVALFLYSLLPIISNTAVGLQTIPQAIHEAANALGLKAGTQLRKIYLPMAMPAILTGIKTSAVINVGNATLAGLIGGGGFGEPIQSGLQLNDNATILEGAVPAAILALLVQFALGRLDRLLISKGLRLQPAAA